ncbi:MAG: response regulator [Longimicrobiales bacterium]
MLPKAVLLVEDNEDNRFIYSTILQRQGYRVLEARTGEEGVSLARERRPDLILMDISLPRMDGFEATRLLKASRQTAAIPIVAVTAHALMQDRLRAREAGCDAYLVKPIEPRKVLAEVERMIGMSGAVSDGGRGG